MKVVIVGAGPGGLVACKTLIEAATDAFPFDPVVLEQEDGVGGTFRYRSYEASLKSADIGEPDFNMSVMPSECKLGLFEATHFFLRLSTPSITSRSSNVGREF